MVRLTKEQVQFYKENGYIHLKKLIKGKELERMSEEYDKLFNLKQDNKIDAAWVGTDDDRTSGNNLTVKAIHNLQMHNEVFGKYLYNEDLLDAFEDVMETKNIILHHTKANNKPPEKGAHYPMHQDYHYFPYEKDSVVAAALFLDAATPHNGTLFVYPGSHKLGPLEDFGPKEGSNFHYVDQKKFSIEGATPLNVEPGDVVIFSYFTVHGSTPNLSSKTRRMLLVQVTDAHDRPLTGVPTWPGAGWVLRGSNLNRDASIAKRYDS